ncbi:MAG: hypothetical protein KatS3mg034_0264 [Vicingaceae bacterium]|nr:MAG: hypothetical protein KatS3mg034_0264 [Vicingaceae bacterium]
MSKHKKIFYFTKTERLGTLILLVLIFISIIIRFILKEQKNSYNQHLKFIQDNYISAIDSMYQSIETKQSSYERNNQVNKYYNRSNKTNYIRSKNATLKKIDLNTADSIQLESLPYIGPTLSKRIIRYRELLGGFYSIQQLREIYQLDTTKLPIIENYLTIDTTLVKKIPINHTTFNELSRHPYFDKITVKKIFVYLRENKNFKEISNLYQCLDSNKVEKIKYYISFE